MSTLKKSAASLAVVVGALSWVAFAHFGAFTDEHGQFPESSVVADVR